MKKINKITLTESQLNRIIKESILSILNESDYLNGYYTTIGGNSVPRYMIYKDVIRDGVADEWSGDYGNRLSKINRHAAKNGILNKDAFYPSICNDGNERMFADPEMYTNLNVYDNGFNGTASLAAQGAKGEGATKLGKSLSSTIMQSYKNGQKYR